MQSDKKPPLTLESTAFSQGQIKLPQALREELNIQDKDKVLFIRKANGWEVTTHRKNIETVQNLIQY